MDEIEILDLDGGTSSTQTSTNWLDNTSRGSDFIINIEEPEPEIKDINKRLSAKLAEIDKTVGSRPRPTLVSRTNIPSVKIVYPNEDNGRFNSSSRDYKPKPGLGRNKQAFSQPPDRTKSSAQRLYAIQQKFIRLNRANPRISIPDSTNPDELEDMYVEASKTHSAFSGSSSWLMYLGVGYACLQWLLKWFGVSLPDSFVQHQLVTIAMYPETLKALGEPGLTSIVGGWPPWVQLLVIMTIQTVTYILIYKMTGDEGKAVGAQRIMCDTGLLGPKKNEDRLGAAEAGTANVMGTIGSFLNGGGGGAGGGFLGNIMNVVGGLMNNGETNEVDEIDIDNLPEPELSPQTSASSRVDNPFDE